MQKHELKRNNENKKHVQVGRGGKRGKTSGKGHKGQNARAGTSKRPEIRDMIKKLPKLRGRGVNYNTSRKIDNAVVNMTVLESNFKAGEKVTPQSLFDKGLVRKVKGLISPIKIVNTGELKTKLVFRGVATTESAKATIEALKGEIQ